MAVPNSGYVVNNWTINGVVDQGANGVNSYTLFNATVNTTVVVSFTSSGGPTYTISPSAGANGSIIPSTNTSVVPGSNVTLAAEPLRQGMSLISGQLMAYSTPNAMVLMVIR